MAGRPKHAQLLGDYLREPIESACMITRPGATARVTIGGMAGETAAARIRHHSRHDNRINFDGNGWLALGRLSFTLIYRDLIGNRPTGDPVARVAYVEVADVALSQALFTTHVEVAFHDGGIVVFETPRRGFHRPNRAVVASLVSRCSMTRALAAW